MSQENMNKNPHAGHRQKVRNRFYECSFDGMADHNILEFLLFYGIPRKDTNEIAHELLNRFGSYSRVFEAKREDLMKVKGMTENAACLITMILPMYRRYIEDLSSKNPGMLSTKDTVDYLRGKFNKRFEQVYIMCYDSSNNFITCRLIGEGDIDSANFDIRELVSIVLETNASLVILAHNHPHGIALPSPQDVEVTAKIYEMLDTIKVKLADHLIITDESYCSMIKTAKYTHIFYGMDPLF